MRRQFIVLRKDALHQRPMAMKIKSIVWLNIIGICPYKEQCATFPKYKTALCCCQKCLFDNDYLVAFIHIPAFITHLFQICDRDCTNSDPQNHRPTSGRVNLLYTDKPAPQVHSWYDVTTANIHIKGTVYYY